MTSRADVVMDYIPSPRIAEVNFPSTEFIAQDIVDTLRIREESFRGQTESKLINASGKENLGGGVQVGITVELQDTQVAFEGRTTPAEIGSITTASSAPVNNQLDLFDTSGTFIASEIHRGSLVINFTDESIAEVRSIESETHIKTKLLVNGISNTFTLNDNYQIFNVIQCNLTGGNVVAVDEFTNEISPVLPTAFTQVIRTAASSATTQNLVALNYASFAGVITVDVINGVVGQDFPTGTGLQPSNNFVDAHAISDLLGLPTFKIRNSMTITGEDFVAGHVSGHTFTSDNPLTVQVVLDTSTNIDNCIFTFLGISGVLDNNNILRECLVSNITSLDGFLENSAIVGPITLGGSGKTSIINCWSEISGDDTPVVDMGGSGSTLGMRGYIGGIKLINKTGTEPVSIDLSSGQVILDSTVTAGHFVIRGVGKLTDNSTGTTTIDTTGLVPTAQENAQAVWEYDAGTITAGSMGEIQRRLSFQGHIHVNQNDGSTGTAYPLGTHGHPVNNIADAVLIGAIEGIGIINIAEDITVSSTDNIDGFTLRGAHATKSEIIIEPGASTQLSQFFNCTLTGTPKGRIIVRESVTSDLVDFEGVIFQTVINGFIRLSATTNAISFLLQCFSGVPGVEMPELDFNFTGHRIALRDYSGGIKITNKSSPEPASFDFASGQIIIDGTVTNGEIVVRGVYHIEDNSNGSPGITLVQNTNLDNIEIKIDNMQVDVDVIEVTVGNMSLVIDDLIKYQRNKSIIDPIAFTLTIFQDNGIDVLTVFDLKDSAGVASILSIFQRIPQ